MPKKLKNAIRKNVKQVAHIRMEYLRRNREYQDDLKTLREEAERRFQKITWGPLGSQGTLDYSEVKQELDAERFWLEECERVGKKWDISRSQVNLELTWHESVSLSVLSPVVPIKYDFFDLKEGITLKINLDCSKEEIMAEVERRIDRALKMKAFQEKKRAKVRRRLKEWETGLKIYDLREQGMTFSKIATLLSDEAPDALDTDTVRKQYNRARKLVNGGYRKIR